MILFRVRFRVQFRVQRISFATVFYPVVTVFYPVGKGIGSRIKSTKNREPCKFKGSRPKADDGNRTFQQPHIYGISEVPCANSCASSLIFGIKKRPPKGPIQREGKRTSPTREVNQEGVLLSNRCHRQSGFSPTSSRLNVLWILHRPNQRKPLCLMLRWLRKTNRHRSARWLCLP